MIDIKQIGKWTFAVSIALMLAACSGKDRVLPLGSDAKDGAENASTAYGDIQPGAPQDFEVNVGDRVHFVVDQSSLTSEAKSVLDKQTVWLNNYPNYQVVIEGHADERGTRAYNIGLSARRATTVQNYLVANGVAANRVKTISYGKERPVESCDDVRCWNMNRRAVTLLLMVTDQ